MTSKSIAEARAMALEQYAEVRNDPRMGGVLMAFLAALSAKGLVIVPREPTGDMILAGRDADEVEDFFSAKVIYEAMIAAALQGKEP